MSWDITGYDRRYGQISTQDTVEEDNQPAVTAQTIMRFVWSNLGSPNWQTISPYMRQRIFNELYLALERTVGVRSQTAANLYTVYALSFFGIYRSADDFQTLLAVGDDKLETIRKWLAGKP
jgi:hypothetical protein